MLLKLTSADLLEYMWRLIPGKEKQSHCSDAAVEGVVFSLDVDLTAAAATAGERWPAAPYFGGQIIQIGCRCEFAPNINCLAWMTS